MVCKPDVCCTSRVEASEVMFKCSSFIEKYAPWPHSTIILEPGQRRPKNIVGQQKPGDPLTCGVTMGLCNAAWAEAH